MIYLDNITTEQAVLIPSNGLTERPNLLLTLRSTVSGEAGYQAQVAVTEADGYYSLSLTLPAGVKAGEYRYSLSYELETYASGLCQIGAYRKPIYSQGEGGITIKQSR